MADIQSLITACPVVADATGVSSAIYWLATVGTYADKVDVSVMPNKNMTKSYAFAYWEDVKQDSTDYANINNKCYHIKGLLQACLEVTP